MTVSRGYNSTLESQILKQIKELQGTHGQEAYFLPHNLFTL